MSSAVPDSPVLLILGEEDLLVRRAEQGAVEQAFGGGPPGFNLGTFSAEEGAGDALGLANTLPMMAKRRVVVIRRMEKAPAALLDQLLTYVEKPNPSTLLVLSGSKLPGAEGGVDRGRRLENRVAKLGGLIKFAAKEVRPLDFARDHARAAGCELDPQAGRLLVELVGTHLGQLSLELDKAIAFVGGAGPIDAQTVETVCSVVSEAVVWDLTDAVINQDPDRGLAAAHRLLEDAESGAAHRLLHTITWQVRQLLELQDSIRSGRGEPPSWRRVPRQKLESARRLLQQKPLDPARIIGALTRANRDFNRSRAGDRRVFEGLILELTTGAV